MMEKYAYNLEEIIEERTQQLIEETKKTDRLLYRMLPSYVTSLLISVIYVNNNLSKYGSEYESHSVGESRQ